jgi:hypothetical protein
MPQLERSATFRSAGENSGGGFENKIKRLSIDCKHCLYFYANFFLFVARFSAAVEELWDFMLL